LKYIKLIKFFLSFIAVNLISVFGVILTHILFYFFTFDKMIVKTKKITSFFLNNFKKRRSVGEIFYRSRKVNELFCIKSCLKIAISQKIIYSFLGHHIDIVSGVKKTKDNLVKGHAWIEIEGKKITRLNENVSGYIESFRI